MQIGFSFAIPTVIYVITSPLVYIMTSKIKKTAVIFLGYGMLALSLFMVGPSLLFRMPNYYALTMVGLCVMGVGCGMVIIPILPDMIECIEEKYPTMN